MKPGMKMALGALACALHGAALADHRVGNGGDAVVCLNPDGTIRTARLLDYVEAAILQTDWTGPAFDAGLTDPVAKAIKALERIARFDPERGRRYIETAQRFLSEAELNPNARLLDINDSSHLFQYFEDGCEVKQLAVQARPLFPNRYRYVIDEKIWDKLEPDHRAGLILHEIFYGEADLRGQPDSVMTRYLTAEVSTSKLDTATEADYQRLIDLTGFAAEHWYDHEARWRWALLPDAPRTFVEAQAACAALAGEYTLPSFLKIKDAHPRLAASHLSDFLVREVDGGQAPFTSLWTSSLASGVCADGSRRVKAFAFPADLGQPTVELVCESDRQPMTLCLSEYWLDAVPAANAEIHGEAGAQGQPDQGTPEQQVEPAPGTSGQGATGG